LHGVRAPIAPNLLLAAACLAATGIGPGNSCRTAPRERKTLHVLPIRLFAANSVPTVSLPRPVHLTERHERGAVAPQTEMVAVNRDDVHDEVVELASLHRVHLGED
jgi:hypothetical protein